MTSSGRPAPHAALPLLLVALWLTLPAAPRAQTVTKEGIDRGDSTAAVTVVEFADFGCSACAQFARESFQAIDQEFIRTGRVRWRFVPFVLGPFRHSKHAAAAAVCAAEQDAFWRMHDLLFEHQRRWSAAGDARPVLSALAADLGLDLVRFDRCQQGDETADRVRDFNRQAARLVVRATPTFFINEQRVRGALPLEMFRALLTDATDTTKSR